MKELKPYIVEIKINLIEKLIYTNPEAVHNLIKTSLDSIKFFKQNFEISDEYKKSRKITKQGNEIMKSVSCIIDTCNEPEKLKVVFEFLSPRMDTLFKLSFNELSYSEFKFEHELYKDIVHYIFEKNKGLVHKEAKRLHVNDFPVKDKLFHGYIGLLKGIRKYNWNLPYRMSTYLTYWIRESLYKAINDNFMIKYTENIKNVYRNILEISRKYNIDSLHSLDVDKVLELEPSLKKYPRELIYDALTIDWTYSLDFYKNDTDSDDDSDRNPLIDKYSIDIHESYEKYIQRKEIIEIVSNILNEEELSIFIQEFSLEDYIQSPIPLVNYEKSKLRKVLDKIKENKEVISKLQEALYGHEY